MGEKITDKGLGNGTSLIIMIGILARLPQSFTAGVECQINPYWSDPDLHYRDCYPYCNYHGLYLVDTGCKKSAGELCQTNCW